MLGSIARLQGRRWLHTAALTGYERAAHAAAFRQCQDCDEVCTSKCIGCARVLPGCAPTCICWLAIEPSLTIPRAGCKRPVFLRRTSSRCFDCRELFLSSLCAFEDNLNAPRPRTAAARRLHAPRLVRFANTATTGRMRTLICKACTVVRRRGRQRALAERTHPRCCVQLDCPVPHVAAKFGRSLSSLLVVM